MNVARKAAGRIGAKFILLCASSAFWAYPIRVFFNFFFFPCKVLRLSMPVA